MRGGGRGGGDGCGALAVLTDAPGSIWAGVVASAAHDHLALAGV